MTKAPSAVWIVDTKKEHLAVDEAKKLNIPVVAILDTNCDPDEVDYPIPGNDDAIRSVTLLTRVVADAVAEGLSAASQANGDEGSGRAARRVGARLAEWEKKAEEASRSPARRGRAAVEVSRLRPPRPRRPLTTPPPADVGRRPTPADRPRSRRRPTPVDQADVVPTSRRTQAAGDR